MNDFPKFSDLGCVFTQFAASIGYVLNNFQEIVDVIFKRSSFSIYKKFVEVALVTPKARFCPGANTCVPPE